MEAAVNGAQEARGTMTGETALPADIGAAVTVEDFEPVARRAMAKMAYDYIAGGAFDEWSMAENRRAFERWLLRPRVLVDVSSVDLATTLLGRPVPFPILLAPTALQRLAHPEGEMAVARAAGSLGAPMVLSTISSTSLEDVAATGVHRWFQLYVMRDRALASGLVKRAHAAGYHALVVTVDLPVLGRRLRDERNRFVIDPGVQMANLPDAPLERPERPGSALHAYFASDHDCTLRWEDLAWLRSLSPLPLVLKGILTGEDAARAVAEGVDAIIVSNHGGRQLDGVPAAIDALPEVVEAVGGRAEVYVDGGIRRGTDVLKALGLGARAVLVGRPFLWGLAAAGEAGVRRVIQMLRDELALAMALVGRPTIGDLDRSMVAPAPPARTGGGEVR